MNCHGYFFQRTSISEVCHKDFFSSPSRVNPWKGIKVLERQERFINTNETEQLQTPNKIGHGSSRTQATLPTWQRR